MDAAELWFAGVHVSTSDTDLAWLYNIITTLAQQPIQDAITHEVASQVSILSCLCVGLLPRPLFSCISGFVERPCPGMAMSMRALGFPYIKPARIALTHHCRHIQECEVHGRP